ncbi:glutamate receptor ionotropic, kainate 2 [Condylostylus longicornis]|uniref:glutamate receptor ionotropic, kainate 2 n=1 Tax=Condylostylus longicornis TaxID=2530218 RepID=UPI00244DD0BC|nr:glutamate receptor ionotropic, kainate 2 [Condylostylus longicornis]
MKWIFHFYKITVIINQLIMVVSLPQFIRVGAIFDENQKNGPTEFAFKYAVHSINENKGILPETKLIFNIQYVKKDDSFHATKKVCSQIKMGVQAVFGPTDPILGSHIHSICDATDIPHLETRINENNEIKEFSINLHPAQEYVNYAFQDVIKYLNWTKLGILCEKNYGIIQLRELVKMPGLEVHIRQVDATSYIQILNELKNKEIHNLVIDTKPDNISLLLKGILQLQMNEYKYHYLFTSFDLETFDLEDFKYNFVNITAFRLVDIGDVGVKEILKNMQLYQKNYLNRQLSNNYSITVEKNFNFNNNGIKKPRAIQTEPALMFDSVYIFAIGLQTLEQSHTLQLPNISCENENPWDGGLSLINYINAVEWKGLTGPIQFKEGRRIQFKLDLVKLRQHSIIKVGEWSPQSGLNITDRSIFYDSGTMNVTLVVITILETPYVMMHYGKNFTGNERFFGFCVDILHRVAQEVGFDYILDLVPDRKYGAKHPITGEWNGMVAQLMKHKADLAVGSMTITYARESVIDFTKPFMNLGISILFKVPTSPPTRLFSFMNPLAIEIWLYVLAAYILVSLTMYIVARFSPYEWNNPHPCDTENEIIENQFTIANSFWFSVGTLMQQGSDLNPKATSTRIVSAIWWFFTLIIVSSYTANLAAFLTVERMATPIENAEDLASQTEISYGTLESGSTMTFFRDSMIETYKKMWRFMENKKPSVFTTTYEEGIKRVLEGNYAFLMESTMLDYIVQRACNLTQIGGLLDTKGYGIATPMGSPWRDKISLAILELQEKGEIQMLYDKWWKNAGETCIKQDKAKESKANALGVDNIGGVFVVLLCGIAIAVSIAICEFCYVTKKRSNVKTTNLLMKRRYEAVLLKNDAVYNDISKQQLNNIKRQLYDIKQHNLNSATSAALLNRSYKIPKRSIYSEMSEEFCFALQCLGSQQRPALKRQCSKCFPNNTNLLMGTTKTLNGTGTTEKSLIEKELKTTTNIETTSLITTKQSLPTSSISTQINDNNKRNVRRTSTVTLDKPTIMKTSTAKKIKSTTISNI